MREPGHIKRAPRIMTQFDGSIIDGEGRDIPVVVTDISKAGFRFTTSGEVRIGDSVTLHMPRIGGVKVQIRWALGGEAGGIFLEPVDLRTL